MARQTPMGKNQKELLEYIETQKAKAEARTKSFRKDQKEKYESKDGKQQVASFIKAIGTRNVQELESISQEIEQEYKSQNVTTVADGGYLVPTVMEANIVENLKLVASLRSQLTVISNAPAKFQINNQVLRPSVGWTDEEVDYNATKATFNDNFINAHKITGIISMTEEFEQDALGIESVRQLLERQLAEEIGWQENIAFMSGDGTSRPYGFRNLSLPAERALTADFDSTDFDDVKSLKYALSQINRRGSFFLGNDAIEQTYDKVKDLNDRYIYTDSVKEDEFSRLLGRPFVNADENTYDELWHINGRGYVITDVAGIRIDFGLDNSDFRKGRRSMRVMKRTGGNVILPECFAKLTLSEGS